MWVYIFTDTRLKREGTFGSSGILAEGTLISASAIPADGQLTLEWDIHQSGVTKQRGSETQAS